ncbi:Fc.00g019810.m01.CDS01 [Cosmosporella sp. VM-42]
MADRNLRSGSDFQLSRDNTAPSSSPAEDNAAQDQHALEHEAGSVSPLTSNFNSTFESRRQGTTSQRYSWESGSSAASEGVDQIFDNEDNEDDSDCVGLGTLKHVE